jgi:hypothetical protein
MGVRRVLNSQNSRNAGELGRLGGNGRCIRGADHDGNVSTRDTTRAGHALGGAGIELRAIVLGNDQNFAHVYTKPFLRSSATSSAASFTRMPFCLCGGGSNFTSFRRCFCSTPMALKVSVSSGFFFAFMMSGSFT